jgi:hypothetical protein
MTGKAVNSAAAATAVYADAGNADPRKPMTAQPQACRGALHQQNWVQ